MAVFKVDPPGRSGVKDWYANADLVDSFAILLGADAPDDSRVLAGMLFERPAPWIGMLMGIRDGVMARLGVKRSTELASETTSGQAVVGFFPVFSATPDETILGADDRHLDFRASVLLDLDEQGRRRLAATTVVKCRNRLGRAYLMAIAPFHVLVVRSNLRGLDRRLRPGFDRPAASPAD